MPISDESNGVYIDRYLHQNQNHNSLLVNAKMTIRHQGLTEESLVPSSHKGSKFRCAIVQKFSKEMRESGSTFQSLIAFLVGIFSSRGNLKDH